MEAVLRVMLVEDNPAEAFLLRESLSQIPHPPEVLHAESLAQALAYLKEPRVDAILLDLALPDSEGLATLDRAYAAAAYLPIIVLTGLEDEAIAIEAVRKGAQDYLLKGQTPARQLVQTILHAVERKRYERALALSAERNRLLAEVMAEVVAQTEVEDLLKTVAEAARKLTSAQLSCSGAGYVDGKFRVNAVSHADHIQGKGLGECLNCGICLDLLEPDGSMASSDQALRGYSAWGSADAASKAPKAYMSVHLKDSRGRLTGSIIVGNKEKSDAFTEEDESLLRQLASITSLALQHIESRTAAEAASVAKSQFLANMSHELRTPMNAILGMTDLSLTEELSPKVRDYLETAKESAVALLELLNEILDLSRIEEGRFELESTTFNLQATVEQVIKTLRIRAQEKGLALIYHLPEQVPDRLVGDPLRFRQILMNLVDNAIKFTHAGKIVVQAEIKEQTQDGIQLEFSVSDSGIGIPPEDQDRIFAAFTQADASTTRNYGGTGLGLTISRRLVELMDGRIWVQSQQNQGSVFYFTMHLKLPHGAAAEASPAERFSLAPYPRKVLRVLLAEDTPTNQKVAAYLLARRGHKVEIAADGRRALELMQRNAYDVVLMDVQMPLMDGFQATAAIRALPDAAKAGVPIIAMTAHALKGDAERCIAAGMDAYVSKPIQAEELIELVEFLGEPGLGAPEPAPDAAASAAAEDAPPDDGAPVGAHMRPRDAVSAPPSGTSAAVLNLQEAVSRCFGKHDFFLDMVDCFYDEADPMMQAMREALGTGLYARIRELAHRLKNTVVYLGAQPAVAAIAAVEAAAKAAAHDAVAEAVGRLELQMDALKLALASHHRQHAAGKN